MDLFSRAFGILFIFIGLSATAQLSFEGTNSTDDEKSDLVVKDITAPRTDLLRTEVGEFIFGPATRIKFKIVEEESGLATTNFKIADLPYMKSDGRQMVPHQLKDGVYQIEYYSLDNEGNQEQVRTNSIYIDKKGPQIRAEFNDSPDSYENGLPVFSSDFKLVVKASDEQVNVQKLTYKVNGGSTITSENDEFIDFTGKLDIEGEVKIEILAYDSFYNLSKEVVEFVIKK